MRPPPPHTMIRSLRSDPPTSTYSYLSTPRLISVFAVLSWSSSPDAAGILLEGRARSEVVQDAKWGDWGQAALLEGTETSHVFTLEPGLEYSFRMARLTEAQGQLPFSEPSEVVSVLCSSVEATTIKGPSTAAAPPPATRPTDDDAMPWDVAPRMKKQQAQRAQATADVGQPWDAAGCHSVEECVVDAEARATPGEQHPRADEWRHGVGGNHPLLTVVPTTPELALLQAQASLNAAVRSGATRLRVETMPPGLNKVIENSHAYSEPLLGLTALALAEALRVRRVCVVFPSAGTGAGGQAAFARAVGRPVSAHVSVGALLGAVTRDGIATGVDYTAKCVSADDPCDVYIVAAPTNSRGDAVVMAIEQAVHKVPSACWVLLNPDLEDTILSYTFGIKTSSACRSFVRSFGDAIYHYKGVFRMQRPSNQPLERGALLHHHGGPWVAFRKTPDGWVEGSSFDKRPSKEQLSSVRW